MIKTIKSNAVNHKKLDYISKFRLKTVLIEPTGVGYYSIINNIMYVSVKVGIDIKDIMYLMYCYELGVFSLKMKFFGKEVNIGHLLDLGYLKEDYSFKGKKLYSLSNNGFYVVDLFNESFKDSESNSLLNKKTSISKDVKSITQRYLHKKKPS